MSFARLASIGTTLLATGLCGACASTPPAGQSAIRITGRADTHVTVTPPVEPRAPKRPPRTAASPTECPFLRHDGRVWVTPSFALDQFASRDGAEVPRRMRADICFVALTLERVQDALGRPLRVNSAFRSRAHNASLRGASKRSRHLLARAVDADADVSPKTLAATFARLMKAGDIPRGWVKAYRGHVHYHLADDVDVHGAFPGARAPRTHIACRGSYARGLTC